MVLFIRSGPKQPAQQPIIHRAHAWPFPFSAGPDVHRSPGPPPPYLEPHDRLPRPDPPPIPSSLWRTMVGPYFPLLSSFFSLARALSPPLCLPDLKPGDSRHRRTPTSTRPQKESASSPPRLPVASSPRRTNVHRQLSFSPSWVNSATQPLHRIHRRWWAHCPSLTM
jgi:hypothetical protein